MNFLHVSSEILVICGDMHGNMNPELFLKLRSHTALLISAKLSKKKVDLEQKYAFIGQNLVKITLNIYTIYKVSMLRIQTYF